MKYINAKKLHNGDEIIIKKTNEILSVVSVEHYIYTKDVYVLCNDGNKYHHKEIK